MKEFMLKSFDDTDIYVTVWDDVSLPKGVVQIVHGMSEYGGRYDEFARFLNKNGYIAFADDHRAHGRTEKDEDRGRHKGDIFTKTLNDELFFREWLKKEYGLPVFLMGHSYGSFLCQAFAQSGTDVKAIALLGTGHMRGLFTLGKIAVAPIWAVARNWRPKFVNKISDSFFKFKGDSGRMQWLNSVPERRESYFNDKYLHSDMSVNFDFCMMRGVSKLYSKKALSKLDPTTSIGIFCGSDDTVGRFGKGAKKLHETYLANGINSELKIYDKVRHEVLYDHCANEVWEDLVNFFDKFIIYKQTSLEDLM